MRAVPHTPSLFLLPLLALAGVAAAQPVPDAGQIQREVLPRPTAPLPAAPPIGIREPAAGESAVGGARFAVQAVALQGNTVFSNDELIALVADLPGPGRTLADVQAAAQRITAHYRANGYPVARAFVPTQDVTAGQVRIDVFEGRIDRVELQNRSRLSDAALSATLGGAQPGEVIASAPIDRALLLWNSTPGVGAARATLQPGERVGTSRLGLEFDPAPLVQGSVALDNHGSSYTGRARLAGLLQIDSPLGLGDQLGLSALTSGRGLRHGRIAYELPVSSAGIRAGLAHQETRYRLGGDFAALQAGGRARRNSAFVSHPFVLTSTGRISATFTAADQSLHDRVDAVALVTDKSLTTISGVLRGSWNDLAGQRLTTADLQIVSGRLRIQSPAAAAQDAATARTQGHFTRWAWELSHLQRVAARSQIFVTHAGQRASRNLDSAEKFAIGGPRAVRAYAIGEASGDKADRFTLEWRQVLSPALHGVVFYDIGRVQFNRKSIDPGAANHRTLSGAGIGLSAEWSAAGTPLSLQTSLAWPLLGRSTLGDQPTLWFTFSARF